MTNLVEKEEDGIMDIFNVTHNNEEFLVYSGPHMLAIANADNRIITTTMINDNALEFDYMIPDYASGVKESFRVHPDMTPYKPDDVSGLIDCMLNKHAELMTIHA